MKKNYITDQKKLPYFTVLVAYFTVLSPYFLLPAKNYSANVAVTLLAYFSYTSNAMPHTYYSAWLCIKK